MKKIVLTLACVGFAAASALAGDCPANSCGDKDKAPTPTPTPAKPSLVITLPI
ncbi:MAG: hypothetical protein WCQ57_04195 [Verrucomicrobiota bacterium]